MRYSWIYFLSFIFFIVVNAISFYLLFQILKTRYANFYKKDSVRGTIWKPYQRILYVEMIWNTPYWVEQEKDARILIWLYRLSNVFIFLSWFLLLLSSFKIIR